MLKNFHDFYKKQFKGIFYILILKPSGVFFFLYEMRLEPNCTLTMCKVDGPIFNLPNTS